MSIARHDTISMIDVNLVAVAACIPAGLRHHAIGCRYDRCAKIVGNVNSWMKIRTIPTQTERRTDFTACRPHGGNRSRTSRQGIRRTIGNECRKLFLLFLQNLPELLQACTANGNALFEVIERCADILRIKFDVGSALSIACRCCLPRTICRRVCCIGGSDRTRHAAHIVFHLRQPIQFLLQAIRLFRELQKLLLLHVADLAHLFHLRLI